jgi:HD-GYP domain-containing protein (c-di-GMP phosphodiesterase class II)
MFKDDIYFLGVGDKDESGTSIRVSKNVIIDSGNLLQHLNDEAIAIEHIFLTHSHLDHIIDIPFFLDRFYEFLKEPIKIYGLKETIEVIKKDIFNWSVWPDFSNIKLLNLEGNVVEFIELEFGKEYKFDDVTLKPFELNHTVPTAGYLIKKPSFSAIYATDTHKCEKLIDEINRDKSVDSLIVDISFSSEYEELASDSGHLTPMVLKSELTKIDREIDIYPTHIKPTHKERVQEELRVLNLLNGNGRVVKSGEFLKSKKSLKSNRNFADISTALSQERDLGKILELILTEAISYTGSEGGTIYLKDGNRLKFKAVINKKLNIYMIDPDLPSIPLYMNGEENRENVSARCVNSKETVNIPDVYRYNFGGVSFEGVKKFDKANGYRTKSMLVIPMIDQDGEVIGVLQLINKISLQEYSTFTKDDMDMTSTYANWAASAITKNRLIESLEELLLSFLKSISVALARKSQYGYSHIDKVAKLMKVVSKKISEDKSFFPDVEYDEDQLKELEIAAWMHDVGKIATPEYIIDKATKLETIYDRVAEIESRFDYIIEALKRIDLEIKYEGKKGLGFDIDSEISRLESDIEFIKKINQPSFLTDSNLKRLKEIKDRSYKIDGREVKLLSDDEFKNLSIRSGTLTDEERLIINEHAKVTYDMLSKLNFPKKYSRVKEIACAHHEKLDGSGYPMGLKGEEISFEARVLAVIDIFEALTATDRPYKKRKSKEETLEILYDMAKKNHIDKRVVEFIEDCNLYDEYIKSKVQESVEGI